MNKKKKIVILAVLALLLIAGLGWYWWAHRPVTPPPSSGGPVAEQPQSSDLIDVTITTDGTADLSALTVTDLGNNQYSAKLSPDQIAQIRQQPGVLAVDQDSSTANPPTDGDIESPPTDTTPDYKQLKFADYTQPGATTGYRAEVKFDTPKLSPYPTSIHTATVQVLDSAGQLAPVNGCLWITPSYGYGVDNLTGSINNGELAVSSVAGKIMNPGGSCSFALDGSGRVIFKPAAADPGQGRGDSMYSPIVEIKNGVGQFRYQIDRPTAASDKISFIVRGYETSYFAPRDPQYSGTNKEPLEVWRERTSKVLGYDLYSGNRSTVILKNDVVTVVTVAFGGYGDFSASPAPADQQDSNADYYYEISAPASLTYTAGAKFSITIAPRAKLGKSLPSVFNNAIGLDLIENYQWLAAEKETARSLAAMFTPSNKDQAGVSLSNPHHDARYIAATGYTTTATIAACMAKAGWVYDSLYTGYEPAYVDALGSCYSNDFHAYLQSMVSHWDPEVAAKARQLLAEAEPTGDYRTAGSTLFTWIVQNKYKQGGYEMADLKLTAGQPVTLEMQLTGESILLPYITLELSGAAQGPQKYSGNTPIPRLTWSATKTIPLIMPKSNQ